jgi:hypothetical protein
MPHYTPYPIPFPQENGHYHLGENGKSMEGVEEKLPKESRQKKRRNISY